jgi:hypothetical protein
MFYLGFPIQAESKFIQIQQSLAKAQPRQSKEKVWISLDSLVRNEPFQWVIVTPWAKKSFSPSGGLDALGRLPSATEPR